MCRTLFRHVPAAATRCRNQDFQQSRWNLLLSHFPFDLFTKHCFFQPVPGMRCFDPSSSEMCSILPEGKPPGTFVRMSFFFSGPLLLAHALRQKCVAFWCLGGVFIGLRSAMTACHCTAQDKARGVTFRNRSSLS